MSRADVKPPVPREKCGTYAGANAHRRYSEAPCDPCRKAATEYVRDWRRRTGQTTRTLHPVPAQAEPSYADLKAANLLAQSLIQHRLDTASQDVQDVLAVLRGDLTLGGSQ